MMRRFPSIEVLVLMTALSGCTASWSDGCGSFGHACFNATHFEICVQNSSGSSSRSGVLQACPADLKCDVNAVSICSEVAAVTETAAPSERTEDPKYSGGETFNIHNDVPEAKQDQPAPNEQFRNFYNIEPFNIQQPDVADLTPIEFTDPELIPQEANFQPDSPSGSELHEDTHPGNHKIQLIHVEPSESLGSSSSFSSSNFTCPGVGLFPAPPSCTNFHVCIRFGRFQRFYTRSCWRGFEFSPRWRVCLPRRLSDCPKSGSRSADQDSEDSDESGSSES